MNPETPNSQELLATIAQHESTVQRHETAPVKQETLMAKHSQVLSDLMTSVRQTFDRLPSTSATAFTTIFLPLRSGQDHICYHPPFWQVLGNSVLEGTGALLFKLFCIWKGVQAKQASERLLTLRQSNGSPAEYAIQFRLVAAGSGSNDKALVVCFLNGLSEAIKDDLATREPACDLETLMDQAIRLDNHLRERSLNCPSVSTLSASPTLAQMLPLPQDSSEPMQLGRTRLSLSERDRCMRDTVVILWVVWSFSLQLPRAFGKRPVPYRQGRTVTGVTRTASPSNSGLFLLITLTWGDQKHQLQALIDSGTARNFMDISLAKSLQIPTNSLPAPLTVTALDGRLLSPGKITHLTSLLCFVTYQHQERMCFHLIQSPEFPVILGHPWLLQHNPQFDWSTGAVLSWGPSCQITCLAQNSPDPVLECQEPLDLSQVPAQYHHLKALFSKRRATSLPPHRPYDCAIELLPGTCPPRDCIFSLSPPEKNCYGQIH